MTEEQTANPWYKEFWAWFILAPLITTVILSAIMVTTAVKHGDDVLTDDYYKKGRMINQSLERVEWARTKGLQADLKFDLELGDITMNLTSIDANYSLPDELTLYLDHPIDERLDRQLLLRQFAPSHYRADLDSRPHNRWYLRLEPVGQELISLEAQTNLYEDQPDSDHPWRLNGEIDFNVTQEILLKAL